MKKPRLEGRGFFVKAELYIWLTTSRSVMTRQREDLLADNNKRGKADCLPPFVSMLVAASCQVTTGIGQLPAALLAPPEEA
ncbi:MAG TPA: hypothetical protein VIU41_12430, partial [Geobacteraceae bacterium]